MRPHFRVLPIAAFLSLSAAGAPLRAQDTRGLASEPIPRELVEALLAPRGAGPHPAITVGLLPPSMVSRLFVPQRARILGGMYSGSSATAILLSAENANTLTEVFQTELPKLGWEFFKEPSPTAMFSGGEFIDAPDAVRKPAPGAPQTYCGRAGTLMLQFEQQGFNETRITATTYGSNRCADYQSAMMRGPGPMAMRPAVRAPVLVNPAAAANEIGICPSMNVGMGTRGTELNSLLAPQDLLTHYGKQLADSGWKQAGTAVAAVWTRTDTSGTRIEYEMTISTSPENPTCRKIRTDLHARTPH